MGFWKFSPEPCALLRWGWFFSLPGDPADTDYTAVGCAITTISSNLTEMSKGVKLLAALMDDEVGSGEDLLRAARTLAGAVSDLLKAVQPTSGEVSSRGTHHWGSDGMATSAGGPCGSCFPSCSLHPDGVCFSLQLRAHPHSGVVELLV